MAAQQQLAANEGVHLRINNFSL